MPDQLIFMMGKYEAIIPTDREYSQNHVWLIRDQNKVKVGFTSYAVRLMQDVYFLEWSVDQGSDVKESQELGDIESSKAVSSLHAPCGGQDIQFNEHLLDDPSAINDDSYGNGWLYTLKTNDNGLSAQEYLTFLNDEWEKTQKIIKGQIQT